MGIIKSLILFLFGGLLYFCIEIICRGYSHWTMFLLGGVCFVLIGQINKWFSWTMPLWLQCTIAAVIITVLEFITGCIVNLGLGWHVWDYSDKAFNLWGQICPKMIIAWFVLSLIGIVLDDIIRWKLFREEKPRYYII